MNLPLTVLKDSMRPNAVWSSLSVAPVPAKSLPLAALVDHRNKKNSHHGLKTDRIHSRPRLHRHAT
jgi:hypothetical protein